MTAAIAASREPLRLPGRAESVARARRFVTRQLTAYRVAEPLVETAALLVSEIVTNAVVHVGGEVGVLVDATLGRCALVEVRDRSPIEPTPRRRDLSAMTGRGLALVEALASSHGTVRRPDGKVVWFTVGDPAGLPVAELAPPTPASAPAAPDLTVLLRGLPVGSCLLMRQHDEALLREYQLHLVGSNDAQPRRDAAQHRLDESLAELAGADRARAAVANAVRRAVEAEDFPDGTGERKVDLTVRVPREDVSAIRQLPTLLDAADLLAGDGVFLTPPAEPGMVALRNWLYSEVLRQTEGSAASVWSPT